MKVFIQSIVAQLLLHPYICWRGYQALPSGQMYRLPFVLLFALESLIYFTGFFFHTELPDSVMIPILYICNTWYIAMVYLTMSLVTIEALRLSDKWWHWLPGWIHRHWQQTKLTLFFVVAFGVTGLMIYANGNVRKPTVKHVHLTLPKGNSTRDSLTIVQMSDLHIGEMIRKEQVQQFIALSNAQHPDMVVLTGDIMDYESRFAEMDCVEDDLQQLQAPLGIYAVNGNHEYRANRFAKYRWLQKTGMIHLVDSVVMPDNTFTLIGRDDMINKRRCSLHHLMTEVDTTKPVIVIDHQPLSISEVVMNQVDLALHGHTHNGQLWPYPLVMKLVYECPYGYYQKGGSQFYVSSGIGCAGPPYRIGTVSELVVLHIKFT